MDVVLVNPGSRRAVYQELGDDWSAIEPPVHAGLFATFLRKKGLSPAIVDAAAENLSPRDTARMILENYSPLLVVVVVYGLQPSASTQNMPAAGDVCWALKEWDPECKILMTGTHPAALPERTLREEAIDFVCGGEGPQTILQMCQMLKTGKKEAGDFRGIPGLWYREGHDICSNPPGELILPLDEEMPAVAWDLLPMKRYRAHNWHCFEHIQDRQPYASLYTSLGCPFSCSFCCIHAPFGKSSYRLWTPDTVLSQIDHLVHHYGVRNIKLADEMFVLDREHVTEICDRLSERGYDLNIWAYARVDTVRDEFLDKLRRAGFRWLALGIESGSPQVRSGMKKGDPGTDGILRTVRRIQAAGIHVMGNFLFGLPQDTPLTMQHTLDLALECNCEFANFYSVMAYPGSKLYSMAIERGWTLPDSWIGYSQHSYECRPLQTESLTGEEVLRFRDSAFDRYFNGESYLAMVRRTFGGEVVDHIKRMTQVKLKRKLFEPNGAPVR